jgi:hypothetical protein
MTRILLYTTKALDSAASCLELGLLLFRITSIFPCGGSCNDVLCLSLS